jgi:hypothetical protein
VAAELFRSSFTGIVTDLNALVMRTSRVIVAVAFLAVAGLPALADSDNANKNG